MWMPKLPISLPWLKLGLGVEHEQIPDEFKAVELMAAVETRFIGRLEMNFGPGSLSGMLTGPRRAI